jgi:Xaa-Pro aminopeptidase
MEDFGDRAGYAPGRTRRPEFGNKFLRLDRDLAPGMTVTIEPGIYLVPAIWERADLVGPLADVVNRRSVDSLLKDEFGGIRIENTICVRDAGGPEVLTGTLPIDAEEVASLAGRG